MPSTTECEPSWVSDLGRTLKCSADAAYLVRGDTVETAQRVGRKLGNEGNYKLIPNSAAGFSDEA